MQKKHNRRPLPLRLTPVERAVLRAKWSQQALQAELHALLGEDVAAIASRAGALFYVVLWACNSAELTTDDVDRRIVRGAVMALTDLDGTKAITQLQRNAVQAGLEAAGRLAPRLSADAMALASHTLYHIARQRPVVLRDFPVVDFPAIHSNPAQKERTAAP